MTVFIITTNIIHCLPVILMLKAAEEALSDVLFRGFERANTAFKTASFQFAEGVLTELGTRGSLDVM